MPMPILTTTSQSTRTHHNNVLTANYLNLDAEKVQRAQVLIVFYAGRPL